MIPRPHVSALDCRASEHDATLHDLNDVGEHLHTIGDVQAQTIVAPSDLGDGYLSPDPIVAVDLLSEREHPERVVPTWRIVAVSPTPETEAVRDRAFAFTPSAVVFVDPLGRVEQRCRLFVPAVTLSALRERPRSLPLVFEDDARASAVGTW